MKKFLLILVGLILLGSYAGQILGQNVPKPAAMVRPTTAPTVTPTPVIFATPVNIQIPKLGVTSTVEQVGLDAKKNMDVPKQDMNVGWYMYGPKPGELGNSVIAGHYDTKTGAPAVFYRLSDLVVGDEVIVTDEKGDSYTFTVVAKNKYPTDSFPIETVFGKANERYLNLITCDGVFNSAKRLYSDRLVVRTELKG